LRHRQDKKSGNLIRDSFHKVFSLAGQHLRIEITNHLENKDNLPKSVCSTWQRLSKSLQEEIEIIEKNIEKILEQNSDINYKYKNLQTIPGVGKTTAVAILAESPDLSQFANARQFAAYAGLVPKHRSPGSDMVTIFRI
jgi:transposase